MKKLFLGIHQGRDIRGLFAKEYKATDSSFYAKYESGDWIPYDEKRDTVEFHIENVAGKHRPRRCDEILPLLADEHLLTNC